jgi:plastocyanin
MLWRVTIGTNKGFSPQQQQAQVGDAVFWANEDQGVPHQPVSTDSGAQWSVPPIEGGDSSVQLDLDVAGVVNYKCANHSNETGSVLVANAIPIAAGAEPLFPSTSISTGQSVSWSNSDSCAHEPTPDSGDAWFTAPIESGDISACISFATANTYPYHCKLHPDNANEKGTITVANPS